MAGPPRASASSSTAARSSSARARRTATAASASSARAARAVIAELPEEDKAAALAAHARIGEPSPEQRGEDPTVLAELAYLNQVYEEKFGFRFVVFVDRRTRAELLPVLQERLGRTRDEELETGPEELVRIAEDRWRRG